MGSEKRKGKKEKRGEERYKDDEKRKKKKGRERSFNSSSLPDVFFRYKLQLASEARRKGVLYLICSVICPLSIAHLLVK